MNKKLLFSFGVVSGIFACTTTIYFITQSNEVVEDDGIVIVRPSKPVDSTNLAELPAAPSVPLSLAQQRRVLAAVHAAYPSLRDVTATCDVSTCQLAIRSTGLTESIERDDAHAIVTAQVGSALRQSSLKVMQKEVLLSDDGTTFVELVVSGT